MAEAIAENAQLRADLHRAKAMIREAKQMTREIASALAELPDEDYPLFLASLRLTARMEPAAALAIVREEIRDRGV